MTPPPRRSNTLRVVLTSSGYGVVELETDEPGMTTQRLVNLGLRAMRKLPRPCTRHPQVEASNTGGTEMVNCTEHGDPGPRWFGFGQPPPVVR